MSLKQIINSLALGYIHIKGEFFEKYSETPCKFQQERSLMVILNYVKKFENEMQQTKEELNAAEEIPESKIQEYEKKLNLLENLKKETGKQFLYIMLALKEKFSQPSIFIRHYIGSGEFDKMYIKNGRAFHLGNAAAVSGLHSFWLNAHKTVFAPPEPINSGTKKPCLEFFDISCENRSLEDFRGKGKSIWFNRHSELCDLRKYNYKIDISK